MKIGENTSATSDRKVNDTRYSITFRRADGSPITGYLRPTVGMPFSGGEALEKWVVKNLDNCGFVGFEKGDEIGNVVVDSRTERAIVITDVDANGKVTKWEAMSPKAHAKYLANLQKANVTPTAQTPNANGVKVLKKN